MYELVYCSQASQDVNSEDIAAILDTARNFNSKNGITGCLLYHNQQFIQILEGDREIIKGLFSNIEKDTRHANVLLLDEGAKEERIFHNWSMAFHELNSDDAQDLCKEVFVDNFITFSELAEKPTFPMKLFWNKARQLLKE